MKLDPDTATSIELTRAEALVLHDWLSRHEDLPSRLPRDHSSRPNPAHNRLEPDVITGIMPDSALPYPARHRVVLMASESASADTPRGEVRQRHGSGQAAPPATIVPTSWRWPLGSVGPRGGRLEVEVTGDMGGRRVGVRSRCVPWSPGVCLSPGRRRLAGAKSVNQLSHCGSRPTAG